MRNVAMVNDSGLGRVLDAFEDGGERRVDLAEVNWHVFVNNVSLGLYADAVQRPGLRCKVGRMSVG